eukprot:8432883-Pyramimonas_sp.AAC.1
MEAAGTGNQAETFRPKPSGKHVSGLGIARDGRSRSPTQREESTTTTTAITGQSNQDTAYRTVSTWHWVSVGYSSYFSSGRAIPT